MLNVWETFFSASCSRASRGNLVLRRSTPPIASNSEGIAGRMAELNATFFATSERRKENMNNGNQS